jgi:hypothetical protein
MLPKGQTLRQTPGARTSNAGVSGIRTFQSKCKPRSGLKNRELQMNIPTAQNSICAERQIARSRVEKTEVAVGTASVIPISRLWFSSIHLGT